MNTFTQIALNLPNPLAARQSLFLATDGQPFTTSRAVAERFRKRHKHVLRDIEKLREKLPNPEFWRSNFGPRNYIDGRGKTHVEYHITHNGFALLAMGFTGTDALAWKVEFLEAFNALEAELRAVTEKYAHALDVVRPNLRPVTEGTEHGQNRSIIGAQLGKSVGSITYHRRSARRLGLLAARRDA